MFFRRKKFLSCFIADGKLWKFLWSELHLSFAETADFLGKNDRMEMFEFKLKNFDLWCKEAWDLKTRRVVKNGWEKFEKSFEGILGKLGIRDLLSEELS
jgi:hypothetical protein